MNFLSKLLLSLIGALPDLITTAEKAFSGSPGSGEAKKKLVLDSVVSAIGIATTLEGEKRVSTEQVAIITEGLSALTDVNVKTLNSVKALDIPKAE